MKRKIRKLITGIMTASILSHFLSGTVSMAAGIDGDSGSSDSAVVLEESVTGDEGDNTNASNDEDSSASDRATGASDNDENSVKDDVNALSGQNNEEDSDVDTVSAKFYEDVISGAEGSEEETSDDKLSTDGSVSANDKPMTVSFGDAGVVDVLDSEDESDNAKEESENNDDEISERGVLESELSGEPYIFDYDSFRVEWKVVSHWEGACNVSVSLTNRSDETIHNWNLSFMSEDEIINPYNAKITSEGSNGNKWTFKNLEYNQDIRAGESIQFGFQVRYGERIDIPFSYSINILNNMEAFADDKLLTDIVTKNQYSEIDEKSTERDQVTRTKTYVQEDYTVTFYISSYWDNGYNAEISIWNTSNTDIRNWYLFWDYSDDVVNIWNASIIEHEANGYIIKNDVWNQTIHANRSVSFGISGNSKFCGFPEKVLLVGSRNEESLEDYLVEYNLESSWDNEFKGSITITNNSNKMLENWVLEFDYERTITSIWDGIIEEEDDNHYIIRNADYNANIPVGGRVTIGFLGTGGTSDNIPENYMIYSYNLKGKYIVKFDVCADDVSRIPEDQIVSDEEYAICPLTPMRNGYYFVGWYADDTYSTLFDFDTQNIRHDTTLYARWLDYQCKTDSDNDGLVDSLEEYFGTDIDSADSDGDEISDYDEIYSTWTNPHKVDSDGNGTNDSEEDPDKDKINNIDEIKYGTDPWNEDTDFDGIWDNEEISEYETNPLNLDTDSDGASDGWEVSMKYDPLVNDGGFNISASLGKISEANPVIVSVNVETIDADVESLAIDKVKPHDNYLISPSIAGYIGDAYSFSIDGDFKQAELTFEYDVNVGTIDESFQPRIYFLNEETEIFEELDNQIVTDGKVVATTKHFSTYILLNKVEYDKVWEKSANVIITDSPYGGLNYNNLDENADSIKSFNGKEYALIRKNMTWNEARIYCESVGGYLVTITSEEEQKFINDNILVMSGNHVWIGGFTYDSLKDFQWVTDEEMDYTNWNSGEPNFITEKRIHIYDSQGDLKGKWNNEPENCRYWFICEWGGYGLDFVYDSNGDGISDYYTSLIEDGTLTFSNTSNELKGCDLNYDEYGNLSDDCDGDGLKNGEEIRIVEKFGKKYIEMTSHPMREYSDADLWNDYEEVQRGSNPLKCDYSKLEVDALINNIPYYYEGVAEDMRDQDFVRGMTNYSAIINGVWNKRELYRDLITDYYCTYVTEDEVDNVILEEEKKQWFDALITLLGEGKYTYDITFEINKLISYSNGARTIKQMEDSFDTDIAELIAKLNRTSEDAIELRADVFGNSYTKKYWSINEVNKMASSKRAVLDKYSQGISFVFYLSDAGDTIASISRIEANEKLFGSNMEAIDNMCTYGEDDTFKTAARDVMNCLKDKYVEICIEAMIGDISESVVDFIVNKGAEKVSYIAVVVAVRDVMGIVTGTKEDIIQMNKIYCYSQMTASYNKILSWIISVEDNNKYYSYYEGKKDDVIQCLWNIAQLRIAGENEYYNYIKCDGLLGNVADRFAGLDDVKTAVDNNVSDVKRVTDLMGITIGPNYMNLSN